MAKANLKEIQYAFTAHLRDPENNPAPEGIEDRRMGIYRDLLYNNVEGFVSKVFPVMRSIYNDETWHEMVRDFFSRHQSQSPYFLEISQEFLSYLQHERDPRPEDPAGLLELAHYEWVELALNVSDETITLDGIDANGDLLAGHPVLSPLAWSLVYQFPVHKMGPDHLPADAPEQASYLVVYRNRNDEVKFMEINPVTARLIGLIKHDKTLSGQQALKQISQEMQHPNPEVVINGGLCALTELQSCGVILGTQR
ncbi:MAG: putative DNA-binding domain-containing protein [Gammaproteobacteria bacterium]|nr:putative DNA-binding domain-containing protein [Gammaproteobacteria bacterium]